MAQPEKENEELEEEKVTLSAALTEDGVLVQTSEDIEGLTARGYGTQKEKGLILEFYEALYLLSKGIIEIEDEKSKQKVAFQDLLKHNQALNEDAWVRYLIYRDLRSRGYVVREGFGLGIDFRVYERGQYGKDTADYLIYGIQEGRTVATEELARVLNGVQNLKKKMILAVLNRRGEVVYYSLSRLTF
jgi:tRNA-intron endonuclease